jgi:hypothetical protein
VFGTGEERVGRSLTRRSALRRSALEAAPKSQEFLAERDEIEPQISALDRTVFSTKRQALNAEPDLYFVAVREFNCAAWTDSYV